MSHALPVHDLVYSSTLSLDPDWAHDSLFTNKVAIPNPRIEPLSPALQADSLLPSHKGSPQNRNRALDIENKHIVTGGKGKRIN